MHFFQNLNIQSRLLLFVIGPVFALSCTLLLFDFKAQLQREEDKLGQHALTTAKFLSAVVHDQSALHDRPYIERLLKASQLEREPYLSLMIANAEQHPLARLGASFAVSDTLPQQDTMVMQQATHDVTMVRVFTTEPKHALLGFVFVAIDKAALIEDHRQAFIRNVGYITLALMICAILVYWVSRSISQPIREMTSALKRFVVGEQPVGQVRNSLPEIKSLQTTINEISREMQHVEADMRHRIQDAQAQLRYQARHDALTGLVNRQELERRLQQALEDVKQHRANHVFCYMDLDQFRVINDTCGHLAGDEMLRQISMILSQRIRAEDTFARLGGDEFGLLLSYCQVEKAIEIAAQLRQMVEAFRFMHEDRLFQTGISIGVVEITPDLKDVGQITRHADAACYVAKDNGRNQIHLFHSEDDVLLKRHVEMEWVSRINEAIEHNDFVLYCQGIFPLQQKDLPPFYEILIRKRDEHGGIIPPAEFLPSAERYHLMTKIDRWVIQHAFMALQPLFKAQPASAQPFIVSINLSGMSLGDASLLPYIKNCFTTYQIPPGHVCFEVTETSAIINIDNTIKLINELKQMGVRFMLDDFGSGMSSFSYLKHLPVDFLKMDGAYVRDITSSKVDLAMAKAIQSVAQSMEIKTIAEYVEDQATLDCLKEMGVAYAQGFYLNKPMPLNDVLSRHGAASQQQSANISQTTIETDISA
ncbi:diguanylate cyclase (GGDEF) domain-containing protein [Methylophilus rhizosphaerae]|uniref:Diguanylate cyclase (GGDEF) domain-containing protein n=1 Tax=Methylophilus rhizosphaerae TaxID=492660 RepID=A0A1G8ZUM4_9PROT|nr:EAL domain-containing protein [Methylophilus rhizosphaerae]SDK18055.1 diguanylate cyclase (GGDEF) domain-containing protein [Methylophilus rhizosphaerae]